MMIHLPKTSKTLIILASILLLSQATLLVRGARMLRQQEPMPITLTGTLEVVDVGCRQNASALVSDEVATQIEITPDDQEVTIAETEDDTTETPVVDVTVAFGAPAAVVRDDVEYYLTTVDARGGVLRRRLFFSASTEQPSSQVTSGWSISVTKARPAVTPADGASCDPTFVPQENTLDANVATATTIIVDDWMPLGARVTAQEFTWPTEDGSVWDITTVTFILNFPSLKSSATPQSVASRYFKSAAAASTTPTLEGYFASCSYNTYRFAQENQLIVDTVIDVPATGDYIDAYGSPSTFNSSSCSDTDYNGWATWAAAYATNILKIDLTPYRHGIFIFNNPNCPFTGRGNPLCTESSCRVWLNFPGAPAIAAVFHELGHNFGLGHAKGIDGSSYGDYTCPMGWYGSIRCFNTPHSYQIGWSKPIDNGVLDATTLVQTGQWYDYVIPAQISKPKNHLRITPSTWTGEDTTAVYFVGYRNRVDYDSGLNTTLARKVSVYQWAGESAQDSQPTQILASLGAGSSYTDLTNKWKVRPSATSSSSASVGVCRFVTDPTECT